MKSDSVIRRPARLISIFLLLLSAAGAGALDFNSDSYGSLSDYLNSVSGSDENAGLTAFPVLNIPIGGRAEGMAGAFSAVSDDVSFIEYNPAGSSMLGISEMALFHNNWIADTKVEGAVFASRLNNLGFGAGTKWLYTPFTEYNIYGDRVSKGYYAEGIAVLNVSYNFLSGYYFSGLSVGANLKGAFRFVPDYTDADDLGNNTGSLVSGSGSSQSSAMVMGDVGLLTRFDFLKPYSSRERNMSAALVLRNFGPPAMGDPLPSVVVVALSYKPLRPILFSFDFSVPLNFENIELSEKPYWAAGFSASVTSFLSMRMGLMGKAGSVRVTVGSAVELEKLSLDVNYSMDLLTQVQPLNRVSLGVRFNLGDSGRKERVDQVDQLYLAGLDAYSRGNYPEALQYWESALELDPKFEPAREGLAIISHTQSVQQRIEDMQTLDY
jgi:tetratricopeptide (TPR) repeat protein